MTGFFMFIQSDKCYHFIYEFEFLNTLSCNGTISQWKWSNLEISIIEPMSFVPLFSQVFLIIQILVNFWISRSHLVGVTAAVQWWHQTKSIFASHYNATIMTITIFCIDILPPVIPWAKPSLSVDGPIVPLSFDQIIQWHGNHPSR